MGKGGKQMWQNVGDATHARFPPFSLFSIVCQREKQERLFMDTNRSMTLILFLLLNYVRFSLHQKHYEIGVVK